MTATLPPGRSAAALQIVAESRAMRRALDLAARYGPTSLPVLLVGETGTGKELVAQHLHRLSDRRGELVDVNCGALPREMVESLLFGHTRGAFTGAHADVPGLVSRAAGGTLFLDELASLSLEGQAKLLRVLETREVRRLGAAAKERVDFRLVAAVQDDLRLRVQRGEFRPDLLYRVAGAVIELPPLRSRPEDLLPLAARFAHAHGRTLEHGAGAVLLRHAWPGNVRELRAVVDRAAVLSPAVALHAGALAEAIDQLDLGAIKTQSDVVADDPARTQLLAACEAEGGDPLRIAAALGVSRATLYRRLKAHGIALRSGKSR